MARTRPQRGLGQHRRSAHAYQEVRADAQGRVRRDSGERVRASAIQAKDDLGGGRFDAPFGGGLSDHRDNFAAYGLHRGAGSSARLERQPDQAAPALRFHLKIRGNLVGLAAQTDQHCGENIGMIQDSGDRPAQQCPVVSGHPAATVAVRERDDAIDVVR